jgi:hypothetical protein
MTDVVPDQGRATGAERTGRRRFLARLGAGGLAVAVAAFARPGTAQAAAGCGCCNLAHCPPNGNYQTCIAHPWYVWRCYYSSGGINWQCLCCETTNNVQSSYACWPR